MLTPAQYWDREVTQPVTPASHSWMAHPLVRHYVNESVGGRPGSWPLDWFQETYPRRRFKRALSIGCGTGAFERDLVRRGIVETIDGADLSEESLSIARNSANEEGLSDRIQYFVSDFNRLSLRGRTYDFIGFHQSLHHVTKLEDLFSQVLSALSPNGLLYLDEFVGPSRTYWTPLRIRWYSALYQLFPRDVRYFDSFAMPIQEEDESEAIRSAEILPLLWIGFHVEHLRGYGGNILAMMFPDLVVERLTDEQVLTMVRAEQQLIAAGAPPFHAVITATPKQGFRRKSAMFRYEAERKFPGFFREVRFLNRRYHRRSDGVPVGAPEG
jgi:SAM-dependent methyltransferase